MSQLSPISRLAITLIENDYQLIHTFHYEKQYLEWILYEECPFHISNYEKYYGEIAIVGRGYHRKIYTKFTNLFQPQPRLFTTSQFFEIEDLMALLLQYTLWDPYLPTVIGLVKKHPLLTYLGANLLDKPLETTPLYHLENFSDIRGYNWVKIMTSKLPLTKELISMWKASNLQFIIDNCHSMNVDYPDTLLACCFVFFAQPSPEDEWPYPDFFDTITQMNVNKITPAFLITIKSVPQSIYEDFCITLLYTSCHSFKQVEKMSWLKFFYQTRPFPLTTASLRKFELATFTGLSSKTWDENVALLLRG